MKWVAEIAAGSLGQETIELRRKPRVSEPYILTGSRKALEPEES